MISENEILLPVFCTGFESTVKHKHKTVILQSFISNFLLKRLLLCLNQAYFGIFQVRTNTGFKCNDILWPDLSGKPLKMQFWK
jgi:hypothetical protein